MEIQNQIGEEKVVDGADVSGVKAGTPFLQAKDYKEGQILRNVVITDFVAHNEEREEEINGEKKKFKEAWIVSVNYSKEKGEEPDEFLLRLSSKMVTTIRDELKLGANIRDWTGKKIDLMVKDYNVGKGFIVVI